MTNLHLMKDYFSILEECPDPDEAFKDSPIEKSLASSWLHKLCYELYRGNKEKQTRNIYLSELSKCIEQKKLKNGFNLTPPKGKLPPYQQYGKITYDPAAIIERMQANADELMPNTIPVNYQSHLSTKIFDNNQGACAYVAVSLSDPKEGPVWLDMKNKDTAPKEETTNQNKDCNVEVDVEFLKLCLTETAKEIAGQSEPGQCKFLEDQLELYQRFLKNYDKDNEVMRMDKNQKRTFLLMNFQTDLINALQRYK